MPLDLSSAHQFVVALTDAGLWEAQKRTIGAVALIVAVESVLVVALVRLGNRRRDAQRMLEARLRFERRLSNLAVSLATAVPERFDDSLDAALRLVATDVGADAVWRWTLGMGGHGWDSAALRGGQAMVFASGIELPDDIRARVPAEALPACSAFAVPLAPGGVVSGAIFWLSYDGRVRWSQYADELRVAAAVVATVLQAKRAEAALERSDRLKGAILDSLPALVAVVDSSGHIIAVNDDWMSAGHQGGVPGGRSLEPGMSYLDALAGAAGAGVAGAAEALFLCKLACRGERTGRPVEYRCSLDGRERWFLLTVEPLRRADGGAVVTHSDITEQKVGEIALRESESRFRTAEQMLRDVNRRLLVAQEDERRRIARELHDHLNQQLALLAIELQQLSLRPPASQAELTAVLHEEWRRTTEIASDVHAISHRLHPSKLESLGLVATVRAHCRDMSRKSLITHFDEHDIPPGIPPETALCMFRVAEEALSNVARHSGAAEAFVTLFGSGGDIVLRVSDVGSGFEQSTDDGAGLGLVSMRERVQALGGAFSIRSMPGKGTVVEARVACAGLSAPRAAGQISAAR